MVVALQFMGSSSVARSREPTLAPTQAAGEAPLWVAPNPSEGSALTPSAPQQAAEEVLPTPVSQSDAGPASPLPADHHPWGRFEPGAWRRLLIVSETFDENGLLVGRSETQRKETLLSHTQNQYTLRLETTIDVGGKRLPGPTQELTYGLLTDSPARITSLEIGAPATISLQGQAIPCEQWLMTLPMGQGSTGQGGGSVETLYYNADIFPYLLRRERQEIVEGKRVGELTSNVVRIGVPIVIDSAILSAYHTVTTRKSPSGATSERQAVSLQEVPGGLVSESATEYGVTGRRVRWTVTRLVAYGLQEDKTEPVTAGPGAMNPSARPEPIDPRPRRMLRMLRRSQRKAPEPEDDLPLP